MELRFLVNPQDQEKLRSSLEGRRGVRLTGWGKDNFLVVCSWGLRVGKASGQPRLGASRHGLLRTACGGLLYHLGGGHT